MPRFTYLPLDDGRQEIRLIRLLLMSLMMIFKSKPSTNHYLRNVYRSMRHFRTSRDYRKATYNLSLHTNGVSHGRQTQDWPSKLRLRKRESQSPETPLKISTYSATRLPIGHRHTGLLRLAHPLPFKLLEDSGTQVQMFLDSLLLISLWNLPVTKNLFIALRHLRRSDPSRILWIDAICIYFDRYQTKYRRNLRFGSLFSEGFGFASRINTTLFIRLRVGLPILRSMYPCSEAN